MPENNPPPGVYVQCGWGRLIFAHTYPDPKSVAEEILSEKPGQRDIAFYLTDPHIVLNQAPQELFMDPSNTFRIRFENYVPSTREPAGFRVVPIEAFSDLHEINRIYESHRMVPIDPQWVWDNRQSEQFRYFIAKDPEDRVLGVTLGVDHMKCFPDLLNGSSLWALAVDKQAQLPGIGEWLVRAVIEHYLEAGRDQLDLSVMHDNEQATRLYEKLGFERVAVFAVKTKNLINENLFVGEPLDQGYNPYATLIIKEALRRGIKVLPIDPPRGYFTLQMAGRSITCRESLSELTTAIAMSRCDDKSLTLQLLKQEGLKVPEQVGLKSGEDAANFQEKQGRIVIKPARGEQGRGVFVDINDPEGAREAYGAARCECEDVLGESFVSGEDLRVIVINEEVVAAAIRKPPEIFGTGKHSIRELIGKLSRRRKATTGGESEIPFDAETERCVSEGGYGMDDVLPAEATLRVRKAANLHTGGTIHDVTGELSPALSEAALRAAKCLSIPVVGLDFIVQDPSGDDYVIIEANERPGLANHEPQPTAQKFIDFLFPQVILPQDSPITPRPNPST